ncbi:MAG: putative membrane protein YecN with MAPEG domain [Pseudohongiellaceae bacterium]|jgi:uncharacterized membrane protein YecN with MAPEG domain
MLSITPVYGSLLALIVVILAYRVTIFRRNENIGLGDELGSNAMKRAVRAHGNAVENIPIGAVLLLILELNYLTPWLLHFFGSMLIISRVIHAWGISANSGRSKARFYGTLFTWLTLISMIVINLLIIITRA